MGPFQICQPAPPPPPPPPDQMVVPLIKKIYLVATDENGNYSKF